MKASRRSLPIVLSCLFAAATTSATAGGGSSSLLDPYAHIAAPEGKKAAKSALPASEDPNAVQSTATYVTMPFDNNQDGGAKTKKGLLPGLPGKGLLSGLTKPMKGLKKNESSVAASTPPSSPPSSPSNSKSVGDKVASGGKWMTNGVANSGKKMKEGLASTGGAFAKGAKAIGDGFKATGSKMKEGTQAVGSKIAGLPGALKRDGGSQPVKSTPVVAEKPKTQSAGTSKLAFLNKIKPFKKGQVQQAAVAKAPVTPVTPVKKEENLSEKQIADVNGGPTDDLTASPSPAMAETPVAETKAVAKATTVQQVGGGGNKVSVFAKNTTNKIAATSGAMTGAVKNSFSKLFKRGAQAPAPQTAGKPPTQAQRIQ